MFNYYTDRGLTSVEIIVNNFKNHTWWLPDLIPSEVLDIIKQYVSGTNIEYYQINDNFTWAAKVNGNNPKVFYTIDYFGKETKLGTTSPPNTITVRDAVWLPYPFLAVEHHQIWFNSLRKILPNTKGSSIVSPFRLSGIQEVPNIFQHPSLTWAEISIRWNNFYTLADIFGGVLFTPDFPTVFPIRLKNRDKVIENLGTSLPEVWKNKYNLPNPLFKDLMFITIDSRYTKESLTALAEQIMELNK
jgi:hypothetical protein